MNGATGLSPLQAKRDQLCKGRIFVRCCLRTISSEIARGSFFASFCNL